MFRQFISGQSDTVAVILTVLWPISKLSGLDPWRDWAKSGGMKTLAFMLMVFLTAPMFGSAQTCAEPEPRADQRQMLLDDLASAPDFMSGQIAAGRLWEFWMEAPDEAAHHMLQDGMSRRQQLSLEGAETILDELVSYCPHYAEGWNQRAFVRFLRDDFEGSLADIEEVLKREPAHFGALSGKALALMKQGKPGLAKLATLRAIQVHPWLNERALLGEGEDI